jgi:hypothetical protein
MLNWEQTDKLNEIASNGTMSAKERYQTIQDHMREWAGLVNERTIISDYERSFEKAHSTHSAPIDPYMQSSPMTHKGYEKHPNPFYP